LAKWLKPLPKHVKITNHTLRVSLPSSIDKEFIGAVIGPGGKIIQEMQRETGATISIEEKDNQGVVQIFADNKAAIDAALPV
jgi:polyribonucleotide nucleotidyltransferase